MATKAVEIDTALLERLRKRDPAQSEAELRQRAERVQRGFETIRRVQERNAAAGVDADEVEAEAARVVTESRREQAAQRAAG